MKKKTHRLTAFAGVMLAMTLALAQGAAPALAASSAFFVGTCHSGAFGDIQSAVDAAKLLPANVHKTIIICPGTYTITSFIDINGVNNLKIRGKKNAVVTTPDPYSGSVFHASVTDKFTIQSLTIKAGPNYSGNLVDVSDSTRAVVQKLTIDGQGHVGGSSIGILMSNTNGLVSRNKVLNWHSPANNGSSSNRYGIGAGGPTNTVRMTGNTIENFEGTGIVTEGLGNLIAKGNKISSTTVNPNPVGRNGMLILLSSGVISGNKVTGGAYPATGNATGIQIVASSNLKVSGNKLSNWDFGVVMTPDCTPAYDANNVRITRNQIKQIVSNGVEVVAIGNGCDTIADHLTITGNKFANSGAAGAVGVRLSALSDGTNFGYITNVLVKGNKAKNFADVVSPDAPDGTYITGTIANNKLN